MGEVEDTSTPKRSISKPNSYLSVVPWSNAEEFMKVYQKLYSPSITDKQWAVDEISIWETRCYPSLPTAIETTVVVVGAIIQDMLLEVQQTFSRQRELQTLYSMAIVRFINLVLQTEGKNLTILADQHNIPRWVLELRHNATHSHVPNLSLLRMGAKFAIKYLEDIYWKEEAANICQIVKAPYNIDETVFNVILKFKNVQFSIKEATGDVSELETDLSKIIEILHSLVKNHKQKFVEALVKPDVFLSAEDVVRLLKFTGETIFLESVKLLTLPKSLQEFWFAVIRILHTADLISYFLEMLLLSLVHCTNVVCQKTAASWTVYLLNEMSPNAPYSIVSNRFKAKGVHLYLKRLLYASTKAGNRFSCYSAQAILSKFHNQSKYSHLIVPLALKLGLTLNKNQQPEMTPVLKENISKLEKIKDPFMFTKEELESDYNEEKLEGRRSKKKKNIWSLAPETINFPDFPLGAIMNPAISVAVEIKREDDDMNDSFERKYIIEENDKEPVEVKGTSDINQILQDPEIGDMMYSR